jgi:hypothetical protein
VDPKDKFAVLLYFGNFMGGSFLLAPLVGMNLPVRRFDVVFVKSSLYPEEPANSSLKQTECFS